MSSRSPDNWLDRNTLKSEYFWNKFDKKEFTQQEIYINNILQQLGVDGLAQSENNVIDNEEEIIMSSFSHYLEERNKQKFNNLFGLTTVQQISTTENITQSKGHAGQRNKKVEKKIDKLKKKNTEEKDNSHIKNLQDYFECTEDWSLSKKINLSKLKSKNIPCKINKLLPLEWHICKLMRHIYLLSKIDNSSKEHDKEILSCYFGVKNILNLLNKIEVKDLKSSLIDRVNPILINDLQHVFDNFKNIFYPNPTSAIILAGSEYPKMFQYTDYDELFPASRKKPYNSQKQVINLLKHDFQQANIESTNGALIVLNTPMGQGKTSLVTGIVSMVSRSTLTSEITDGKEHTRSIQVIFVCPQQLLPVATQVGNNIFKCKIPWEFCYIDEKGNLARKANNNCFKKNRIGPRTYIPPNAIITDIQTVILILKKNAKQKQKYRNTGIQSLESRKDYLVFFDEPTAYGMDQLQHPVITKISSILKYAPRWLILSSATLKKLHEYPNLEILFRNKYPNSTCSTVSNCKILIGSEISNMEGNIYVAHSNCTNTIELTRIINELKNNPLIQKCYTPVTVNNMFEVLSRISTVPEELHFGKYMNEAGRLNQQSCQDLAIIYLEYLLLISENDENLITSFCNQKYTRNKCDFNNLVEQARHLNNQTLVVTEDPLKLFVEKFSEHYDQCLKEIKFDSFSSWFDDYDNKYKSWLDALKRFEESQLKAGGKKDNSDEVVDINFKIKEWKICNPEPTIEFPENLKIGYNRLSSLNKDNIIGNILFYKNIKWNEITSKSKHDDMLKLLLLAGVGVYDKDLYGSYTDIVVELMSSGKLKYVITNDDICYGTNFPFENILIDETVMSRRSVNTLLQLMARAGRPGKSDRARIWIHQVIIDKLNDYLYNPEFFDIEYWNINLAINQAIN